VANGIVFSFESGLPECIKGSNPSELTVTGEHYKDGGNALKWKFKSNSFINLEHSIGYKPFIAGSLSQARDTFACWIYCEREIDDYLTFSFGRDEEEYCYFKFNLKFTGWRTAWVQFERDMEGIPHPSMNRLTICAPESVEEGTIYIDQLILSTPVDPRFPTRDYQVPLVNLQADKSANAHWLSLYKFSKLLPEMNEESISDKAVEMLNLIGKRYEEYIFEKQLVDEKDIKNIREKFSKYNIQVVGNNIKGNSVDVVYYYDILPKEKREELKELSKSISLKEYVNFMFDIAQKYHSLDNIQLKNELRNIFVLLTRHMLDQGWAEGSSLGTMHHLGYPLRDYYPAVFLMRRELEEAELLKEVQRASAWYSGLGRIFIPFDEIKGTSMDTLNTTLQGMLVSILMMEDTKFKTKCMEQFGKWLSHCLLPAPGLEGPFKCDGSAYHHANHYPAYAEGGMLGVTPVVYFLGNTAFRISEEAHLSLRKAVMMMRIYANKYDYLVSLSARHPNSKWKLNPVIFKFMALAGSADGKNEIDKEAAEAYLRLMVNKPDDKESLYFRSVGLLPEKEPNGHWTMNYAALSVHRRSHWMAGVRGHSRYLWANETYLSANLYGRYITHGHLQILSNGDPVNNEDSGFVNNGWDWNRWPGTTTVHLPIEKLRSDVRNLDVFSGFEEMLLSDEAFCGGVSIEGKNGMFAMKLHEHPKYEGTHRANKSVYFFENTIILLGSDIENENKVYETETTLFQNHMGDASEHIQLERYGTVKEFPYEKSVPTSEVNWIYDNKRNGYYIPEGYEFGISRTNQESRAQDTGDINHGDFSTAWIKHGKAPKEEEYEYAILVDTTIDELEEFAHNMKNKDNAVYSVLQKDKYAHILRDNPSNTICYAVFDSNKVINQGVVSEVDTPCLIMTSEGENSLRLSICDPDLRLYSGIDEDQYDKDGNRIEVSVYSRKWINSPSQSHRLTLKLKGIWNSECLLNNCELIQCKENCTILKVTSRDAMSTEITLSKSR
jgi:chondroitin-sulfate-ABC endolyase/exolyase